MVLLHSADRPLLSPLASLKWNIGNRSVAVIVICCQVRFFVNEPNECLLEGWGNLPSRKDSFMKEVFHSVVIGLAAFMSQAGQGSGGGGVAVALSNTLSTSDDVTA